MQRGSDQTQRNSQELFLSLVEQLSRPMLQINQLAELAENATATELEEQWQVVRAITNASLQLVENYALSLRLHGKLTKLELEPLAISSLLYDTAHVLTPFAKQYGVRLELDLSSRLQPILADRSVLQSAMTSLGQVFILASAEGDEVGAVSLAAHRSRYGVVAGMYGKHQQLSTDSLRRAHAMQGKARQPLQRLVSGPATGVFVAESLLQTLSAHLHVARFHNLTGLAATLPASSQLQLV